MDTENDYANQSSVLYDFSARITSIPYTTESLPVDALHTTRDGVQKYIFCAMLLSNVKPSPVGVTCAN